MTPHEFRAWLTKAISGDNEALSKVLELYLPLINHASVINGRFDEDCREYIFMRLIDGIRKFKI